MGISKIIDKKQYRIKRNGEIFTPIELVNKLISALPKEVWQNDKTFLDPACGNGNLLIAVLWHKIERGHNPLEALRSIYGVDIMPDNIKDCRIRLLKLISIFQIVTEDHIKAVLTNVVWVSKGSLEYDFSFAPVNQTGEWSDWQKEKELPITEALVVEEKKNIFL